MQALTRAARTTLLRPQSRSMSGSLSLEEEVKQMNLWKVVTIFAVPACLGLGTYIIKNEAHHHPSDAPLKDFQHVRSKSFPWGECALFDRKCKAAALKAAAE